MKTNIPTLQSWSEKSTSDKLFCLRNIEAMLVDKIDNIVCLLDSFCLPRVIVFYEKYGLNIPFRLVLPHCTTIGLTEKNVVELFTITETPQINIDEMTPAIKTQTKPFLISELPLTNNQVNSLLGTNTSTGNNRYPAYLDYENAIKVVKTLHAVLPSEVEWECIAKCAEENLFTFGSLPKSLKDLAPWMHFDLSGDKISYNKFGIGGLFFGEWTRSGFSPILSCKETAAEEGGYCIKGGGAYFWPWQDEEWVWCLSSMRMPSIDLDSGVSVVRPVILLE